MTPTSSRASWWSRVDLLAVLLFLLILGRCGQELHIGCPDFFWHVKTGERIVRERRVIWRDEFSHTATGRIRVPQDWLFEVGEYLVYSRFGLDGVILGMGILAAAGVTLMYWMLRHALGLSPLLALPLAWVFWGTWADAVTILRPRVLEALGLLVVLYAVTNWTHGRHRTMLWLIPFFALWANLHGSFVYGIAVCLWFLAVEAAREFRGHNTHFPSPSVGQCRSLPPENEYRVPGIRLYVAACVAATFASAAHYKGYVHTAEFVAWDMPWGRVIFEWQPWQIDAHSVGAFVVVGLVAALCLGRRPVSVFWTAVLAGTFWYALYHRRFVPMFVVVAVPVMGVQLQEWASRLQETVPLLSPTAPWRQWLQRTILVPGLTQTRLYPFIVCAMTIAAALAVWPCLPHGRTIYNSTNPGDYPFLIADTVWRYDVPGRMLNTYGEGGFLIFRLWPKQRVFVDGRDRVYGDKLCFDASDAISGAEKWRELFAQYGVTFVIARDSDGVVPKLDADAEWVLVQHAEKHRLYLKRCKLNEEVLRRLRADGMIPGT